MSSTRLTAGVAFTFVCGLAVSQCASQPATPPASAAAASAASQETLTPVLSVRELMTHIIDPTADWIFDAAVVDVSTDGTTTTMPATDEDWLRVERGALTLAESANLLKMPRPVAPPGTLPDPSDPGKPPPELPPLEIQAKIEQDRPRWNRHADDLRVVALASLTAIKARDSEALFKVGNDIDNACESCHLEYWYPGDKAAVLRQQNSTTTYEPARK